MQLNKPRPSSPPGRPVPTLVSPLRPHCAQGACVLPEMRYATNGRSENGVLLFFFIQKVTYTL